MRGKWAYQIYTEIADSDIVREALGRDFFNGFLDFWKTQINYPTWRFEIDYQLSDVAKKKLRFPNPWMRGYTEVDPSPTFNYYPEANVSGVSAYQPMSDSFL